jgi:hypothetical protein
VRGFGAVSFRTILASHKLTRREGLISGNDDPLWGSNVPERAGIQTSYMLNASSQKTL